MISLTINGQSIQAEPGVSVLQAARQNGIQIPTLCDHPNLTPYGGCRLCVVEVKGLRVPMASCTLPVSQGMVVETETPGLRQSRQVILSLLFSERNHFCPFCQVSGTAVTSDCELQQAAYHQDMTHWPMQPQWNNYAVDTTHPYFILDNNRCILCRRCVRACAEMSGNFTLGVEERGAASVVVADANLPLGQSSCISCGSCVQVCPTGALIERSSAYQGSQSQLTVTQSVCAGCSVGCGINVMTRDGHLVRIEGDWNAPVNHGVLCKQGRFKPAHEQRQRLTTPMIKVDGELRPVSWDEALDAAAARLKGVECAALISPRLPVETLYAFKRLFKDGLHSHNVVSLGGEDAGAEYAAHASLPLEGRLDMLSHADCVLAVGTDLTNTHEVAGFMVKRNLQRGVKLIVIAPQESDFANLAHYVLRPGAGSVADVLDALSCAARGEGSAGGEGFAEGEEAAETLTALLRSTGLEADLVQAAAQALAQAAAPVIVYESDLYASPDVAASLVRLAEQVGALDAGRKGLLSLKGSANSLAAAQLGLDGSLVTNGSKAVYLALGDDELPEYLVRRLQAAPCLVVQAAYASSLTASADVVLPSAIWAEQSGAYLNLEGRLQQANAALPVPAGVSENTAVLQSLAQRLQVALDGDWRAELAVRPSLVTLTLN